MQYHVEIKEGKGIPVLWIGLEDLTSLTIDNPVIAVNGFDWNEMLSPWKSEKVFRNGDDFAGKANQFLDDILKRVVPEIHTDQRLAICGYSLAGLFALWSVYQTDVFSASLCISGSLWFDGMVDYCQNHKAQCDMFYFSLGDKESQTKNERMKTVEDSTRRIMDSLQGKEMVFEWNPGNHFVDEVQRCEKGIRWLNERNR